MPRLPLVLLLIALAGWVDAVGYLQLGGLFVSFMSGNTTQMSVELGRGQGSQAATIAALIGVFVLGVFVGTLLAERAGRWRLPVVLAAEVALLGAALVLPAATRHLPWAGLPVAAAMGLQNATLKRVGNQKSSLTYVTGALVSCGTGLAEALLRKAPPWAWSADLALWLAMATGATAGAASFAWLGWHSLAVPAAVAGLMALASLGFGRQGAATPAAWSS